MKQLLLIMLFIAFMLQAGAQTTTDLNSNKKIIFKEKVSKLSVNDGITVVLIDDETDEVFAEGKAFAVAAIRVENDKENFTISSRYPIKREDAVVYVSAHFLKKIEINGSSLVGSYQPLQNKILELLINGNCELKIKTFGKIVTSSSEDYQFMNKSTTSLR